MTIARQRRRSSRSALLLATIVLVATGCASAPRNPVLDKYPAGVNGRTSVTYYDVHGRTFAELRADMRRLGPKIAGGSFVGETRSPMTWSWRTESTGAGGCSLDAVRVTVNAQILLPRWTPPADADASLVTEWNRFIAALEAHEAGHKDISAKAAREIIEQLHGMHGLCSQISTRANDVARVIVDRAREEQQRYDAETQHGVRQGTGFGPANARVVRGLDATGPLTLLAPPRPGTIRGSLSVPLDSAWRMMETAFASNGLAINATDSVAHAAGDSLTVRRRLGETPLGELLDCSAAGSTNADALDVTLFVTSRLEPRTPSGTVVLNTVQSIARPPNAPPVACRSRGVLERRLFQALRTATNSPPTSTP